MRIGVVAPPWTPVPPALYGGIELVVDELARGFAGQRHDVILFATGDSTCPVPTKYVLEHAEGDRIGAAVPELRHVIAARAALGDCDIIHDHTLAGPLLAAAEHRAGKTTGPITVTTVHGPLNEDLIDLYRELREDVPILCISHAQRSPVPDLPVRSVIHHGIDASNFKVGDGLGDADGPYCVFLGRMSPDKGAHRAIKAAQDAGSRILIAAKMREPHEYRYYADMVEPLLGDDAVYLGEVSHEKKLELLEHASALLFPIRWNEPFGLVMLEAMACGTPVLAFPEGAAPEVVEDGVTGFLCEDEVAMAKAIGRVGEIERSKCRAAVEGYFSAERMVADHLEMFDALLAAR